MTLFEIGVFKNQILVFHREFYPLKDVNSELTQRKRSNLINIISGMSEVVLTNQEISALDNGKYRIFFMKMVPGSNDKFFSKLFMYAIGDLQSETRIIKPLLAKLINAFREKYRSVDMQNLEETTQYDEFIKSVKEILSDEVLTPGDRVRNYLF